MGATIQQFMDKFEEFKTLPSGEPFTIEVTDGGRAAQTDDADGRGIC